MSNIIHLEQKEVEDVVQTNDTDYHQNTTTEDISGILPILIASLEVEEGVSKEEERSILDNNNSIINNKINKSSTTRLVDTTVALDIWNKFTNFLHTKYPQSISPEIFQAEIDSAFLSVVNTFKSHESKTTTSSTSLLFDGSLPREDRLRRLGSIASQFGEEPNFPEVQVKKIQDIIKEKVGKDERTRKKYFECIKQYSTPIRDDYGYLKYYNISRFYHLIPREYLLREDE